MPLEHSKSKAAFKRNVSTLMDEVGQSPHVKSRKQALAIAYATQRRGHKGGYARRFGSLAGGYDGGSPGAPMQLTGAQYANPTPSGGGGNPLSQLAMSLINRGNVPMGGAQNAFNPPGGQLRIPGGYAGGVGSPMRGRFSNLRGIHSQTHG
jgi:hypothetical protein